MNIKDIVEQELKNFKRIKDTSRDESDTERKRRIFQHDDLDKLARGIVEEDEELEEKKEKKKNCSKGNPYHDSKGRLSSPESSGGSWSVANKSSKSGCKRGKAKRPSGRQERFTKLPCGRLDVDSPNKKAKNKCKGGSVEEGTLKELRGPRWLQQYQLFCEGVMADKPEEEFKIDHEHIELPHDPYEQAKKQQELEVIIKKLKHMLKNKKGQDCPLSYQDGLKIVRNLELAQKGSSEAEASAKLAKDQSEV